MDQQPLPFYSLEGLWMCSGHLWGQFRFWSGLTPACPFSKIHNCPQYPQPQMWNASFIQIFRMQRASHTSCGDLIHFLLHSPPSVTQLVLSFGFGHSCLPAALQRLVSAQTRGEEQQLVRSSLAHSGWGEGHTQLTCWGCAGNAFIAGETAEEGATAWGRACALQGISSRAQIPRWRQAAQSSREGVDSGLCPLTAWWKWGSCHVRLLGQSAAHPPLELVKACPAVWVHGITGVLTSLPFSSMHPADAPISLASLGFPWTPAAVLRPQTVVMAVLSLGSFNSSPLLEGPSTQSSPGSWPLNPEAQHPAPTHLRGHADKHLRLRGAVGTDLCAKFSPLCPLYTILPHSLLRFWSFPHPH